MSGHEWGVQIAYRISQDDAARLANGEPAAFGDEQERLGPGCFRCKMVWNECSGRPCPGERPKELDTLRQFGESKLWGLDRKERRRLVRLDKKRELKAKRRGEVA